MLSWNKIEDRAVKFQKHWKNCEGNERQEAQTFEKDLMNIFGVDWKDGFHEHQITLKDGFIRYIDYFIPGKILIEMKSKGQSLAKAYTQAMGYVHSLKPEEIPTLVVVSDFDKMQVYNLEKDHRYNPFKVSQIKKYVRIFGILAGHDTTDKEKTEIELNTDASYKMAELHDILKENGYDGHNLEIYLVRLLFCLFAEDTGIFEKYSFREYVEASEKDGSDLAMRLMALFNVLNTPLEKRMNNLSPELKRFRYINGNLFKENLPLASFNENMRNLLLECCMFNWSEINPTIFGAIFQGVMDQEQRRNLGAHYTSEENIMKVLEPLFLDELYDEFERSKSTVKELKNFQHKLASLKFLDPACGSGNFLIMAYQKIRELEFEIMKMIYDNRELQMIGVKNIVHINQFYGIEYEEFPVEIAKVSMILMKHLMDQKVSNYFGFNIIDFPIKENANIINANALRIDWNELIDAKELDYIIGNPPFVGARLMNNEQKSDINLVFNGIKNTGNLDYVSAWYAKSGKMIKENRDLRVAFVSTNSICQGEQVSVLWKYILEDNFCKIDFAYRTFKWSNDAKYKAAVYCIIIGFSSVNKGVGKKTIYENDGTFQEAQNINGYLVDADNAYIESRRKPLCDVQEIGMGNQPIDDGNYLFTKEEMEEFIKKEPKSKKYFIEWYGAREFINNNPRYCLYLGDLEPSKIRTMPHIMERVEKVREFRLKSNRKNTLKIANTPTKFQTTNISKSNYLLIPRVTSENRKYIPIGFMSSNSIASDAVLIMPNASIYHFGILTSNVHNTWVRVVGGRLKVDYRYSKNIVYNNFPWPETNEKVKIIISQKAELVLKVRQKYKDWSYADLYDPLFMPEGLLKAHRQLDKAVWEAYGEAWNIDSESDCVEYLMKLYTKLILLSNKVILKTQTN